MGCAWCIQGAVVTVSFLFPTVPSGPFNTWHLWDFLSSVLKPLSSLWDMYSKPVPFMWKVPPGSRVCASFREVGFPERTTCLWAWQVAVGRWPYPQASQVSGYLSCSGYLLMPVAAWAGRVIIHKTQVWDRRWSEGVERGKDIYSHTPFWFLTKKAKAWIVFLRGSPPTG